MIESYHNGQTAVIVSDVIVIHSAEEGTNLMADLYYQGFNHIVMQEQHFTPAFFDLRTGLLGEVLQKVSNFRLRVVLVGNFDSYTSQALHDFIRESNKSKQVNFVPSIEMALNLLA